MTQPIKTFGGVANKLARSPLGIIALFIVMVYGLAAIVATLGRSLATAERLPLIYFLIGFPVLVLGTFAWLVSRHSTKLFAPGDFRDEENYVRTLTATASLAVASVRSDTATSTADIRSVVQAVQDASVSGQYQRDRVLWVDDRPNNNINERRAFEALGITFTLAMSTDEALDRLDEQRFAVVISDMGREEGPREGYVLLDALRGRGDQTPFFIYAGSNAPEHKREAQQHGGQGSTNNPEELFRMVMRAIVSH